MIQVNHLEKSFEGFYALKGVDMHVEKGAIYGLVVRSESRITCLIGLVHTISTRPNLIQCIQYGVIYLLSCAFL